MIVLSDKEAAIIILIILTLRDAFRYILGKLLNGKNSKLKE